jgi:hypothetical protein
MGFEGSPVILVYGEGYAASPSRLSRLLLTSSPFSFPSLSPCSSSLAFFPSPSLSLFNSGLARLTIELLQKAAQQNQSSMSKHRIVLLATSNRWSAKDHGINERDFLCVDEDNVAGRLDKMGGAAAVICSSPSFPFLLSFLTLFSSGRLRPARRRLRERPRGISLRG